MGYILYGIGLIVLLVCAFYTAAGWSTGKKHRNSYWILVMVVVGVILFYIIRLQIGMK